MPLSEPAVELLLGYQALGYTQPSAVDQVRAEEFISELTVLTVSEMLARMAQHLEHCEQAHLPKPKSLAGFWRTLRAENDFRRDSGAKPRDHQRAELNGHSARVGDVLRDVAPLVTPRREGIDDDE